MNAVRLSSKFVGQPHVQVASGPKHRVWDVGSVLAGTWSSGEWWHHFCLPILAIAISARMRSMPGTKRLSTRTNKRKRAVARFCGDCGSELAPDGEGRCPMCARFQQFRMDLPLPPAQRA